MVKHILTSDEIHDACEFHKPSWIIHYVCDSDSFKEHRADVHTHGLENICGYELQITLLLPPKLVAYVINTVGSLIASHIDINPDDYIYGLFDDETMPLKLEENFDCDGKTIMRILMPDQHRKFGINAEYPYNMQSDDPYLQ